MRQCEEGDQRRLEAIAEATSGHVAALGRVMDTRVERTRVQGVRVVLLDDELVRAHAQHAHVLCTAHEGDRGG